MRVEVAAPRSKVKLCKDRIPGVFSMELGWRGEPEWNQGEQVSKILRTASAEISSQLFQEPGASAGRCLAISNRSTQPIRLRPGQVIMEAELAGEEDEEVWTPPPAPAVKKLNPQERKEQLWKELKLEQKEVLTSNPKLMKEVKELVASYEDVLKRKIVRLVRLG